MYLIPCQFSRQAECSLMGSRHREILKGDDFPTWQDIFTPNSRAATVRDGLRGAPELNPVEYLWAYWKQHELHNVCPQDYRDLSARARKALRRMRRKPRLIAAFGNSFLSASINSILRETQ